MIDDPELDKWALKPSLMVRKPVLGVAPALCPTCQALDTQLRSIIGSSFFCLLRFFPSLVFKKGVMLSTQMNVLRMMTQLLLDRISDEELSTYGVFLARL